MTRTKSIDVENILQGGSPTPRTPSKAKALPHKAGKTTNSSKKRTWKKPKDKPKRPLSAYNLFFKEERARLISGGSDTDCSKTSSPTSPTASVSDSKRKHRKSHGKIGFAALAQTISKKWKSTDAKTRRPFEAKAAIEKARYKRELGEWQKAQKDKKLIEPATTTISGATDVSVTPTGETASSSASPKRSQRKKSPFRPSQQKSADKKTADGSTSATNSQQQEAIESLPVPLSLPSNMPFYPMNLKGMPTTANIAPITLQSLMPIIDTSSRSSSITMPPSALNVHMINSTTSTAAAVPITPDASPSSSPMNHYIIDDYDILSDLEGSIESILDDVADLPSLPVFSATGASGSTIEQDAMMMQNDTLMPLDGLMDCGDFNDFLGV